jgi:hypothetical protein
MHLAERGPTRSSKAARLSHVKPGYYTPAGRPLFVPGMRWLGLLLPYALRFVLRWRKDSQLLDAAGNRRLTWKLAASANAAGRNAGCGMRDVLVG